MPIRGRRLRRSSSNQQALDVEGSPGEHIVQMAVHAEFTRVPYITMEVLANFADRKVASLEVFANLVDRKRTTLTMRASLIEVDGDTKTFSALKVFACFIGDSGYPTQPRISMPGALVVGQPLRRHREIIPSAD